MKLIHSSIVLNKSKTKYMVLNMLNNRMQTLIPKMHDVYFERIRDFNSRGLNLDT